MNINTESMPYLLSIALSILLSLLFIWIVLVVILLIRKPETQTLKESLQLLPDIFRLVRSLSKDPALARRTRVRIALALLYLASPIDLIPDFIPILGYADDAIILGLILRSIVRQIGKEALLAHWEGSAEGLKIVRLLAGVDSLRKY